VVEGQMSQRKMPLNLLAFWIKISPTRAARCSKSQFLPSKELKTALAMPSGQHDVFLTLCC